MFSILELVLSPIVWLMESLLILYVSIIPSLGFSIILLSFSFSFLLLPIQIRLRKIESNISKKIQKIDKELSLIDKNPLGSAAGYGLPIKINNPDILEAEFNSLSNNMFHQYSKDVREDVGIPEGKNVFSLWQNWLMKEIKARKF